MPSRTVYLETFGCQMNELDSELVAGQLRALGYRFTDRAESADVLLYNTCSVRDHAEQKVRSRLGELRLRKLAEPGIVVGVLGCMAERDGAELINRMPVVDVLCGPGELDKLPMLLDNAVRTRESMVSEAEALGEGSGGTSRSQRSAREVALQGSASRRSATLSAAEDTLELLDLSRAVSAEDHDGSAYVRITRGCNKFCTYCVVPHTRGAEVHRPPEHVIDECKKLADAGVIEVTLLGQTVNHYRFEHGSAVTVSGVLQPQKGRSYLGGHRRDPFAGEQTTTFAELLRRIHDEVPSIKRLRFVTSYPRDFGDDVLEVMRDHPRICRYLHVPVQSGSDRVLRAMNRGYTTGEYFEFIDRARAHLDQPEIGRPLTLASDLIAGFCGEEESDHAASMDLLRRARFKNAFIFRYSPRPGTTAYDRLPDDVAEETKRRRVNELLGLQQSISDEISREQIGRRLEVFVQGVSAKEKKKRREAAIAGGAPGSVGLTVGGRSLDESIAGDGCAQEAPSAEVSESGAVQLTARTDGDLIAVFDCPRGRTARDFVGRIVPVRITGARQLTLFGEVVEERRD